MIPGRSEVKVLNPVAIKVFSLLDGEHSIDQIVLAVRDEFEVEATEARKDVEDFLGLLGEQGLLAAPGERAPWESEL